jgi:hypothetical protein
VKDIRSLLGAANFFCSHIPNLTEYSTILTKLTKKDAEFEWSSECQWAYEGIKREIEENTTNYYPNKQFPFHIMVSVSNNAFTGIIFQEIMDKNRIVACHSQTWKANQTSWTAVEWELHAFCTIIKKYYYFLLGSKIVIHPKWNWAETIEAQPYHSDRLMKCIIFLQMAGASREPVNKKKGKVYDWLENEVGPLVWEGDIPTSNNEVSSTLGDRSQENHNVPKPSNAGPCLKTLVVAYFGVHPDKNLSEIFGNLEKEQLKDEEIQNIMKTKKNQIRKFDGYWFRRGKDRKYRMIQ